MHERIKHLRKFLKLTLYQFGDIVGFSGSTLSDIERNQGTITERLIIAICAKFNVNETWLRTGEGEMFNKDDKVFQEFFEIYKTLSPNLQLFLLDTAKRLRDLQNDLDKRE